MPSPSNRRPLADKALRPIAQALASLFSQGAWQEAAFEDRLQDVLGRRALKSRRAMIRDVLAETTTPYAPPPARLVKLILAARGFKRVAAAVQKQPEALLRGSAHAAWSPVPPLDGLSLPVLATPQDLADWLDLTREELAWFADERRQHRATAERALQHYRYTWLPKRSGPPRLIEAPKARLKAIQRRILREMLDPLPAHRCAHGFVKGRSCMSAAQQHAGECLVVTADLKDFFLSTPPPRVHAVFRCLGYPWAVARFLTGLCTTATPAALLDRSSSETRIDWALARRYRTRHLPQGAPTSPALANLCAWRLDCRLNGLARRLDARYTRYADDLAFSGDEDFEARVGPFLASVASIAKEEGHSLNREKTRVMRQSGRQRVTGLVVNRHLNTPRAEYERLKAILYNCRRHGPADQNRDGHPDFRAHLNGRVTWVENVNPGRGLRLRQIFEAIDWPADP